MSTFTKGTTVRGVFPAESGDPVTRKVSQVTLADHHSVVLAVVGVMLLVAYAGTDDDAANARRPGFVAFPGNVESCAQAGWRFGSKFYIDAGVLAFVPADKVEPVGKLGNKLVALVESKAGSIRQNPLSYSAKSPVLVTGARRKDKTQREFA